MKQNQLKSGKATDELLRLISIDDARIILEAHQKLRRVTKRVHNTPQYPQKELIGIKYLIDRLCNTGWIAQDERDAVIGYVTRTVSEGEKGVSQSNLDARNKLRGKNKKKAGAPKQYDDEIICFSLTYILRKKTRRPHYELIASFLNEQTGFRYSADYIKRRIKKLDLNAVEWLLFDLCYVNEANEPVIKHVDSRTTEFAHDVGKYDALMECLWRYESKKEAAARKRAWLINFNKTWREQFPFKAMALENSISINDFNLATGDIIP